jgi:magnesium transporter
MNTSSQQHSQRILQAVKYSLDKGRLVENLARQQNAGPQRMVVESLVHRQLLAHLGNTLSQLHPADTAWIIENLPSDDRQLVWRLQAPHRGGDILLELSDPIAEQLIKSSDEDLLVKVIAQLDADDLAYLAEFLPPTLLQTRQAEFTHDDQAWVKQSMQFRHDSVGGLMTKDMVVIKENQCLQQVLENLRGRSSLPSHSDKLAVINRRGILVGVLHWQTLVLGNPSEKVSDVMAREVVTFSADEPASEAARAFERYNLVSAPVVNGRGRPIGRLTVDSIMDFVRDDISEDALNAAGMAGQEDLFAPVWNSAKKPLAMAFPEPDYRIHRIPGDRAFRADH